MYNITLKSLKHVTEQEVFDQVCHHLLMQGEKSQNHNHSCKYRQPKLNKKALKCAAGCLIGDNEYNKAMEGNSWNMLIEYDYVSKHHKELITELQIIHDGEEPKDWGYKLKNLANRLDLEFLPQEID